MQLYDLHCHTKLSLCASRNSEMSEFVRIADEDGLAAIGFSDHAWDAGIGRPIDFYVPQTYEKLLARVKPESKSVKVFLGAEGEFAQGLLGVRRSTMQKLDYIIIPHSHTHMKNFVLPEGCGEARPHGRYLFNSFVALMHHPNADLIFGIAHPFWPCGKSFEDKQEILSNITDDEFEYCGNLAYKNNIYLEINASSIISMPIEKAATSEYARFIRNAKKGGARFFLGSDNHCQTEHDKNSLFKMPDYMEEFGLCEDDIKSALHQILHG